MRFISDLKDGDRVSEVYLCKSRTSVVSAKTGREYENVILIDRTGQLDAKIWDPSSGGIGDFDVNDYVFVNGQVTVYNGALQFKIERARRATEDEFESSNYVPCSRFDIDVMYAEIMNFVKSVKDPDMSKLLKSFFVEDEMFIKRFKSVSAAKTVHHGFVGGLLEHSLSVTKLCDRIAANYDYLNRDLLLTCAMLHDAGKVREICDFPQNDYTDEGNFLGHIVIGYEMIMEKINKMEGFPKVKAMEIGHCILAHHGELEYGSPKKPAIAEAVALSMADNLDAKLETFREALEVKDSNDWLGFNKWLDSNIRRTTF